MAPANSADNNFPSPLSALDYHEFSLERAKIGQLLFYDKILSGNRNISCGTCHHPRFGGSDGLSLGIGEGGRGVGPERNAGVGEDKIWKRIPRNASALWNLAAKKFTVLFHDGRVSVSDDYDNNFNSPAEEWLPKELIYRRKQGLPLPLDKWMRDEKILKPRLMDICSSSSEIGKYADQAAINSMVKAFLQTDGCDQRLSKVVSQFLFLDVWLEAVSGEKISAKL